MNIKILFTLNLIFLVVYANEVIKPDSNFKSMHQLEIEKYQNDAIKIKELKIDSIPRHDTPITTTLNFYLIISIIFILVVMLIIVLLVRRAYRFGKK